MHSPAARALLQPRALLHHPRDTLKDLTLAGHVITITCVLDTQCVFCQYTICFCHSQHTNGTQILCGLYTHGC